MSRAPKQIKLNAPAPAPAEPKDEDSVTVTPQPRGKVRVRTKVPTTYLIHALTGQVITHEPVPLDAIDSWTQAQLDARKLELC
jgi:hypothetical protein